MNRPPRRRNDRFAVRFLATLGVVSAFGSAAREAGARPQNPEDLEPIDVTAGDLEPIDVTAGDEPIDVSAGDGAIDVSAGEGSQQETEDGDAAAGAEDASPPPPPPEPEQVTIVGQRREIHRIAGSAQSMDEEELARFEDDNPHRMLLRFPGVYVRGEDGYGLRPNIGMRGGSSDRSKKVTLMEDGILLGPAPYSAPAAYYFPIMTRMIGVEVFKGPSAIRYGPNTIGGALNFQTRRIPYRHTIGTDLAYGMEHYGKAHGYYGYGEEHWGFVVEGVGLRSDGFKELDAPVTQFGDEPDTGFHKSEWMAKVRLNSAGGDFYSRAEIKLGYAREVSNETYLGLTDADFEANPYRRYAASQLDRMTWDRTQIEISQTLSYKRDASVKVTAYRHDFHRVWRKFNGFAGGPTALDVLGDPTGGQRQIFYDVLRGAADSATDDEAILLGTNDREFYAQGIQADGRVDIPQLGPIAQRVRFGFRWHNDQIIRRHTEDPFAMTGGALVSTQEDELLNADNIGSAIAYSGYIVDEIGWGPVVVAPGLRAETIDTTFDDDLARSVTVGTQNVLLPGVGVLYQAIAEPERELSFFGGLHQGFSPVAPSAAVAPDPEVSVNYELGARATYDWLEGELVGFFSDYGNLTGECTFSSGCATDDLDDQFNGGEAAIYGLESLVTGTAPVDDGWGVPFRATYTLTVGEFLTSFTSENPLWGDVEEGDELPHIPRHQLAANVGFGKDRVVAADVGAAFVDSMRELAGQGEPAAGEATDAHVVFDASARYWLLDEVYAYLKVENLFGSEYVASRRPFGARPGRPRFVYVGFKTHWEVD